MPLRDGGKIMMTRFLYPKWTCLQRSHQVLCWRKKCPDISSKSPAIDIMTAIEPPSTLFFFLSFYIRQHVLDRNTPFGSPPWRLRDYGSADNICGERVLNVLAAPSCWTMRRLDNAPRLSKNPLLDQKKRRLGALLSVYCRSFMVKGFNL